MAISGLFVRLRKDERRGRAALLFVGGAVAIVAVAVVISGAISARVGLVKGIEVGKGEGAASGLGRVG
jgi:hypothetical protein